MNIIVCVDDSYGMLFHKRRQSQDTVLREKILEIVETKNLWMNAYTKKQFVKGEKENIVVDELFLEKAGEGDFCFVENVDILPYLEKIENIILFRWNRRYPGDFFFDKAVLEEEFQLTKTEEFVGSSHEKITKEEYKRWAK